MLATCSRLFAAPRKVSVHRLELRDVRNRLSARLAIEVHDPLRGFGKSRPFGEARPVGIAGFREVGPVSAHQVRNRDVFGLRGGPPCSQIVEDVADLRRMLRPMRRSRCLVVEIVNVCLALAFLRLQGSPGPGGPGKNRVAKQVAARLHRLLVAGMRISRKNGISLFAVTRTDLLFERGFGHTRAAKEAPSSELVPMSTGVSLKWPASYSSY